jgi:hydroxymethylbilane synthase
VSTTPSSPIYKLATRGSKLALWQAELIQRLLDKHRVKSELHIVKTTGDQIQDRFLSDMGGKGLFIKELEESMQRGESHLAMHSLKDMPVNIPAPFVLGSILPRHSVQDTIIFRQDLFGHLGLTSNQIVTKELLASLGPLKIGTSSLRRKYLLQSANQKIEVIGLRGNVDTRLRKLHDYKDYDAIILATASMDRLQLDSTTALNFDTSWFIPSPGQGAIAIECPETSPLRSVLDQLDCPETRFCVAVERAVLKELGGDCTMPIGAWLSSSERQDQKGYMMRVNVLGPNNMQAKSQLFFDFSTKHDIIGMTTKILEDLKNNGVNRVLQALNINHSV